MRLREPAWDVLHNVDVLVALVVHVRPACNLRADLLLALVGIAPDHYHFGSLDGKLGLDKTHRIHANFDDNSWLREIETCKVIGPDGYAYEPVWINPEDAGKPKASLIDGLKAPGTWLILIMFFMFSFLTSSFAGFFPTYLQQDLGMDMVSANSVTSVATIANIVAGIAGGFLLNRIAPSKRSVYLFVVTILIGVCGIAMYNMPGIAMVIPFCIVYGLISQLFPPTAYAIAPETAYSPDTVSGTLGVITFGSNLAGACGTFITSVVMTAFGNSWQAATIPNALFAVLAVVAGAALILYMKKRSQQHAKV